MIDIHSHILPGVDDGAQNVAGAIEMLRIAADGGVTHQVLTPHIHLNHFDNNITQLKEHFEIFQEVVEDKGISIKLHLAAEIHIDPNIIQMVESDTLARPG